MSDLANTHERYTGPTASADGLLDYFRCPPEMAPLEVAGELAAERGFFRFGTATCYGRTAAGRAAAGYETALIDAAMAAVHRDGVIGLPFDPSEVADNLRGERYLAPSSSHHLLHKVYYVVRPLLPLAVRTALQRSLVRRRQRNHSRFPGWPVECGVDDLFASLMRLCCEARGGEIPFIWFWPRGHQAAAIMTHDVEGEFGVRQCDRLMDLNDSRGIKSSFQVIPEGRYPDAVPALIEKIRARGFEPNIHDLNHDGHLYENRQLFEERARKINGYARRFGAQGFRAGSLHRNQEWFRLLEFQYEMSVPNASLVEPQPGGCCTVMPYFIGNLVELPLTTFQDHGMYYILKERSIELWRQQIEIVHAHNGLLSFIVHPDYLGTAEQRRMYTELLDSLVRLREERNTWVARPGEIAAWWRQRQHMRLADRGDGWQIEGTGSESARIAFARLVDGELVYRIGSAEAGPAQTLQFPNQPEAVGAVPRRSAM